MVLSGCSSASSPTTADLEGIDGGRLLELGGRTRVYYGDAGAVLELADLADAGDTVLHDVTMRDAALPSVDAAAAMPALTDASTGALPADDAGDGGQDAGEPPGPVLCTDTCVDGTLRCPSAASASGFECRTWPPCYCQPPS